MTLLGNLLLLVAWLGAHAEALAWLGEHYVRADRRLEAAILVGIVAVAWRRFGGPGPALARLAAAPAPRTAPLAALALCLVGELVSAPLGLNLVRASLFVAGTHALLGLWTAPATWRALAPWAALVALTLPVGPFADVYLGFPARLATAELVRGGLTAAGVATLGSETILVLDSPTGPAAVGVDVPCAGVRSLWAVAVFLLAAAAVEGRRLGGWFAAAALVATGTMLAANAVRVAVLVVVGAVLDAPRAAEALHVPLGLTGFAIAVSVGWAVMQGAGAPSSVETSESSPATPSPRALGWALLRVVGLVRVAAPAPAEAAPGFALPFAPPDALAAVPIEPVAAERAFFAEMGVEPRKWRFHGEGRAGTLLVLPARAWRAHHQPEACLRAQGLALEGPVSTVLTDGFTVRTARVAGGRATGVWWFQAPSGTTDDITARTWAALTGREDRWVLVSALLDGDLPASDLAPFARGIRDAVARSFLTESP